MIPFAVLAILAAPLLMLYTLAPVSRFLRSRCKCLDESPGASMFRVSFVSLLVSVLCAGTAASQQDFVDFINGLPRLTPYPTAFVLGVSVTPEERARFERALRAGAVRDPLTNAHIPDALVFSMGQHNPVVEGVRAVTQHLDLDLFGSPSGLEGKKFSTVYCHSNGCVLTMRAIEGGLIRADTIVALGTDWTGRQFDPGDLHGAEVVFLRMPGDPVPKIPAVRWEHVGDAGIGLKYSIPFGGLDSAAKDVIRGAAEVMTRGRSGLDGIVVIDLPLPNGESGFPWPPLERHSATDMYFESIGELRDANQLPTPLNRRQKKRQHELGPQSACVTCAGGEGGGGSPPGSVAPGKGPSGGQESHPLSLQPDRGGISADIQVRASDFATENDE